MAILAGVMSWVLLGAQVAEAAPETFGGDFAIGIDARVTLDSAECTSQSSSVSIGGAFTVLDDIDMKVRFRIPSNVKTKEETSAASVTLTDRGTPLTALKNAARGGVGGNPWILVKFGDMQDFVAVGRCVQGLTYGLSKRVDLDALQSGILAAVSCAKQSSGVNVNARNSGDGIAATVAFASQINKTYEDTNGVKFYQPVGDNNAQVTVTLADPFDMRKGWGAGGVGGNPLIRATFGKNGNFPGLNEAGWSTERRCKDLM